MVNISVIGATGYAGAELMRILSGHNKVNIIHAVSKSFAGKRLSDIYPSFYQHDYTLEKMDIGAICQDSDIVLTCLPHGASSEIVPQLLDGGVRVIDLSGDFRYNSADVYEQWYKIPHQAKHLLKDSVYGMPELYRSQISNAVLVGNPGCYTTSAILALYPLLKAGLVDPGGIIIDAKSGTSGAGRKADLAYGFCEVDENMKAYGIATHRHTSEIEQELSLAAEQEIILSFTPHLLPIKRGIISTIYAALAKDAERDSIAAAYSVYQDEPFVKVYENGLPEIKHVAGSNTCAIGFVPDKRTGRLVIVSCIDNLVKGAAGQAVQNLNIMCGMNEREGLSDIGWYI